MIQDGVNQTLTDRSSWRVSDHFALNNIQRDMNGLWRHLAKTTRTKAAFYSLSSFVRDKPYSMRGGGELNGSERGLIMTRGL